MAETFSFQCDEVNSSIRNSDHSVTAKFTTGEFQGEAALQAVQAAYKHLLEGKSVKVTLELE